MHTAIMIIFIFVIGPFILFGTPSMAKQQQGKYQYGKHQKREKEPDSKLERVLKWSIIILVGLTILFAKLVVG